MTVGNTNNVFQGAMQNIEGLFRAPATAPVTPMQPGSPPAMPGSSVTSVAVPPDTLELGGQVFGAPVGFGQIRKLADGIKPEEAAALTQGNGMDEIFFTDEAGANYVMFAEKSHFEDVRVGYLGRFNGKRVRVMAVDDEANTFKEGFTSIWQWLNNTLHSSFGSEASKSISGLVATSIGSFIAAAAIKTTAPAPVALPAARSFLQGIGNSALGAVTGFLNTMASVVLFAVGAVGAISLVAGVKGYYRKGDMKTLEMVTGNY
jgi:hypothetical protein